jgi:hypothetical protein
MNLAVRGLTPTAEASEQPEDRSVQAAIDDFTRDLPRPLESGQTRHGQERAGFA